MGLEVATCTAIRGPERRKHVQDPVSHSALREEASIGNRKVIKMSFRGIHGMIISIRGFCKLWGYRPLHNVSYYLTLLPSGQIWGA